MSERILEALDKFHGTYPQRGGAEPVEIRNELQADPDVFTAAVGMLEEDSKLDRRANLIALPDAVASMDDGDMKLHDRAAAILQESGLEPPRPDEIAGKLGCDPEKLDAILQLLCDESIAVRLDRKVVMHSGAVEKARKVVLDLFADKGGFETVQFRDAIGVSRKYAVPLLDYFDTVRLTHRSGSRRTPGKQAE